MIDELLRKKSFVETELQRLLRAASRGEVDKVEYSAPIKAGRVHEYVTVTYCGNELPPISVVATSLKGISIDVIRRVL